MSVRSIWSNVLFSVSVSLRIFCLVDLFFRVSGVLKSPRMNALHSISPFNSVCLLFLVPCITLCLELLLQFQLLPQLQKHFILISIQFLFIHSNLY